MTTLKELYESIGLKTLINDLDNGLLKKNAYHPIDVPDHMQSFDFAEVFVADKGSTKLTIYRKKSSDDYTFEVTGGKRDDAYAVGKTLKDLQNVEKAIRPYIHS